MSSVEDRHPADEQLLRYADGELAAREAGAVRAHLEACWQCRMEVQEIHQVVGDCVRYRKELREGFPPPAPWADLRPRFAQMDAALRPSWGARLARIGAAALRHPARWAPVAVAAALIIGVWFQLRETPSVLAAELLRQAIVAADARPQTPRHIQIRTSRQRVTRSIGGPAGASESAALDSVRGLFVAARYNWDDPLSARSYRAWHEQLSGSRDEVITLEDGYRIRTFAQSGVVMEASLTLSVGDLRPVSETLQFRNREWVEIRELPAPPPAPAVAAAPALPHPAARVAPEPPVSATLGEELQVFAALHAVGADLGDPVEVTHGGNRIVVTGVGVDPARQQQIAQALAPLPHVVVRFSEPAASGAAPVRPGASNALPPAPWRLQARLETQLGGRASFEQVASQSLDMSDALMARVYALRRLAERFSPAAESELAAADRQVLDELRQEHAAVLARQIGEMQRLLTPVFAPLAAESPSAPPPALAVSWQAATEDLFLAARRVEVLTAAVFAGSPAGLPDAQLPSALLTGLAHLRALSDSYGRFGTLR